MRESQRFHHLQIRFPGEQVTSGMQLVFGKKQFLLGNIMPQTLAPNGVPIGVVMNGYTRQFELLQDGKPVGAAWFYFYHSFEGRQWGILDELLNETAPSDVA